MSDPTGPVEPPPQEQPYGGRPPGQPPTTPPPGYGVPARPDGLRPEEVTWGGAAHWGALVAAAVAMAFLGPLVVLLAKGNESPWVRRQAVESLNFQLSVLIYGVVSFVLIFVLVGIFLLIGLGILWLVCTITAAVRTSRGEDYRYPLTIRMVS